MAKLTPFQLSCRKALAEPYAGNDPTLHLLQQESEALVKEHEEDEARDRERFAGPITDAMLHTALRKSAYSPMDNPAVRYNLAELAKIINGWLSPVNN